MQDFNGERKKTLAVLKERRDILVRGIASLEYDLAHPLPPVEVDFMAIEEIAKHDIEFLEQCEKKRKEG